MLNNHALDDTFVVGDLTFEWILVKDIVDEDGNIVAGEGEDVALEGVEAVRNNNRDAVKDAERSKREASKARHHLLLFFFSLQIF